MNLSKFTHAYKRDRFIGFFNVLLGKLGFKFRFKTLIQKRIDLLTNDLKKITSGIVQSGHYKSMKLTNRFFWSESDYCSKILGFYEQEVQNEIHKINCNNLINLGGGEGYHALGQLISGSKKQSIIFESNDTGKEIIIENAKINNLSKSVKIFGKAETNFLDNADIKNLELKDSVFLIDIEGDEFRILNEENIQIIKKSHLIIEFHQQSILRKNENEKKFLNLLNKYFLIKEITTSSRDFSKFQFLAPYSDIDRWIMASEGRPNLMNWLVCYPKENN